jgi:hypothetical protein
MCGRVFKLSNKLTFGEAFRKVNKEFDADEVWLPSGKRADVDEKIRYYFAPSLEGIHALDEVVYADAPRLKKGWMGTVNIRFEGDVYSISNTRTFASFLKEIVPDLQSDYISIPGDRIVDIHRGGIRWFFGATSSKIHAAAWAEDRRVSQKDEDSARADLQENDLQEEVSDDDSSDDEIETANSTTASDEIKSPTRVAESEQESKGTKVEMPRASVVLGEVVEISAESLKRAKMQEAEVMPLKGILEPIATLGETGGLFADTLEAMRRSEAARSTADGGELVASSDETSEAQAVPGETMQEFNPGDRRGTNPDGKDVKQQDKGRLGKFVWKKNERRESVPRRKPRQDASAGSRRRKTQFCEGAR